jgi:sirohydrochlorin ferrochelatase
MDAHTGLGIVVVDHGSRRAESNNMLLEMVQLFRHQTGHANVQAAHMELAEPSIKTAFSMCVANGARFVVICPFFLSPGRHWDQDIPRLCAEAASEQRDIQYLVTAPLGVHSFLAELLQTRLQQCLDHSRGLRDACELCAGTDHCQIRSAGG